MAVPRPWLLCVVVRMVIFRLRRMDGLENRQVGGPDAPCSDMANGPAAPPVGEHVSE